MAEINDFDIVDANNTARWPEGMTFAAVNNAARADEGILARFYKDVNGSLTTTGAADAYAIAANQTLTAYYPGLWLRAKANFTNTGPATLNSDGLGLKTIVKGAATALVAGDIASGAIYDFVYDGTNFQVFNPGAGTGSTVSGPGTAVDNNLAQFNGTTGKILEDSGKSIATVGAGKQSVWVPASAMDNSGSGAPARASGAFTGLGALTYLSFDGAAIESAQFLIAMPKSWNEGNLIAKAYWFHASSSGNVVWAVQAAAYGDDDAMAVDVYAGGQITDSGGTAFDLYISPEITAIDAGNTQAEGDLLACRVLRVATDGADTMTVDAHLIGVMLIYTTNANTDD